MPDQPAIYNENSRQNFTAAELLKALGKKGLITSDTDLADFIIKQQQDPDLPFYLKILAGIGAFIASICFIGFLMVADIIGFNNEFEALVWGGLFIGAALSIYRVMGTNHSLKQSFFLQTSFALIAAGKLLFIFGIAELLDGDGWGINLAALMITALTYPMYRLSIERFLSCTGVLVSVLLNILWNDNLGLSKDILYNSFFAIQLGLAAFLLINPRTRPGMAPLAQALVVSLCISVLFLSSHAEFGYLDDRVVIAPVIVNILLATALIALMVWAVGGLDKLKREPILLGITGAILLGLLSVPGVILAIGLMIFGYARHDRLYTLLGALLLPVFLCLYYYNLDITLLQKSGILISSGVILLAGKFYLKLKGWDQNPLHLSDETGQGDATCG
ncbi:DUF4401 domain-containing protein [Kiloniella sp.]|uniref:DUF4401 domain-containing protein n=1 Tax=Kiloniella sp. TaxID=1938587 RepID=UPI003B0284A6